MNLFCRRGSNLSLLLDVSTLGVETMCSVTTPKEVWLQLLHTSSRPLTHAMLQDASRDTKTLNTEYQVTNSHNATLVNSAASSSEYEWLARWSNWLLWRRPAWYSACPLLLRRRSLQTLSAQQSWTSQDIWSKTDTKPSSPVSNLTVEFHLMSFFFFSLYCYISPVCCFPFRPREPSDPEEPGGRGRTRSLHQWQLRQGETKNITLH